MTDHQDMLALLTGVQLPDTVPVKPIDVVEIRFMTEHFIMRAMASSTKLLYIHKLSSTARKVEKNGRSGLCI